MFKEHELAAISVLGLSFVSFPFTQKEVEQRLHEAKSSYKKAASASHPDRGGTAEAFQRVRGAYETIVAALNEKRSPATKSKTTAVEYTAEVSGFLFENLQGRDPWVWRNVISRNRKIYEVNFKTEYEWRSVAHPKNLGIRLEMVRKARVANKMFTDPVAVETPMEVGYCKWFYNRSLYHKCHNEAEYAVYSKGTMTSFCKEHFFQPEKVEALHQRAEVAMAFIREQEASLRALEEEMAAVVKAKQELDQQSQRRKRQRRPWPPRP